MHKDNHYNRGTNYIWNNCCNRNSRNPKLKYYYKYQIKHCIDYSGNNKAVKWSFAVTCTSKNWWTKVIQHDKWHANQIYSEVKNCKVDNIPWCSHQKKHRLCYKLPKYHDKYSAEYGNNYSCMYCCMYVFLWFLSDIMCYNHIGA